jgi:hypothetical protein
MHPGEERLITPELIRATHMVGTAEELVEQLRELARQGLDELGFQNCTRLKYRFTEEFARKVMAKL